MTTSNLQFVWSDAVCCDLCNPAKLAHFEQNGVTVTGPSWRREVCIRCIMTLEDFFTGVPARELELEQEVVDVFAALGDARDVPTCPCGRQLQSRDDLNAQLQLVLQGLLHLPDAKGFDMPVALVMHSVLRVVSLLERCEQCADARITEAAMTLARGHLGQRRPYTKPTLRTLGTVPPSSGNGGKHDT